jgi:hypothetical protein
MDRAGLAGDEPCWTAVDRSRNLNAAIIISKGAMAGQIADRPSRLIYTSVPV